MKDYKNLNEKIEDYYNGALEDLENSKEIKEALDKMNLISDIEKNVQLNINISEIIEEGEKVKLKKATSRFISVASIFSLAILTLASKLTFGWIFSIQFLLLLLLLIINLLFSSNGLKETRN